MGLSCHPACANSHSLSASETSVAELAVSLDEAARPQTLPQVGSHRHPTVPPQEEGHRHPTLVVLVELEVDRFLP